MQQTGNIIEQIDLRIDKLQRDKARIPKIDKPKKRHPAWKQLNGRIRELKQLRKFIYT